jgi:hypothetical protein
MKAAKTSKLAAEVIMFVVHGSQQHCHAQALVTFGGEHKLRFSIRADRSYAEQGRGTVCLWTPAGWTTVHEIPGKLLKSSRGGYDAKPEEFEVDLLELQRVALLVVAGAAGETSWFNAAKAASMKR